MTNQIKNFIEEGEKEFEEKFPLQYWATENYPGDSKDGELNFTRWTQKATEMAKYRADLLKQFISSRQISLIKMLVKEIKKAQDNILVSHCQDCTIFNSQNCMSCGGTFRPSNAHASSFLDTISSKLKDLYK